MTVAPHEVALARPYAGSGHADGGWHGGPNACAAVARFLRRGLPVMLHLQNGQRVIVRPRR